MWQINRRKKKKKKHRSCEYSETEDGDDGKKIETLTQIFIQTSLIDQW